MKVSSINANHNPAVKKTLVILFEFPHIFEFAFCHVPWARKCSAPKASPYNFETFTAKCPPSWELSSQTVTTRLGPRATSNMADKEQKADEIEIKAKKPTDFHGFALYTFKTRRYAPIDLNECLFSM